jgi:hypothetical protein
MTQDYKHDYNDGQIHGWNGGECPVHPKAVVKPWVRSGGCTSALPAERLFWPHDDSGSGAGDIIAFQVVKQYIEPKVIWVNEYAGNQLYAYDTEDQAKLWANSPVVRFAVKYVECIDDAKEVKE